MTVSIKVKPLSFPDPLMEKSFAQSRMPALIKSLRIGALILIVAAIANVPKVLVRSRISGPYRAPTWFCLIVLGLCMIIGFGLYLACGRDAVRSWSPETIERSMVAFSFLAILATCAVNTWRVAHLFGFTCEEGWKIDECPLSDSTFLLCLVIIATAVGVFAPIRMYIAPAIPVAVVVAFLLTSAAFSSPEPIGSVLLNTLMVCALSIMILVGSHSQEVRERKQFQKLSDMTHNAVTEKIARFGAEHKLEEHIKGRNEVKKEDLHSHASAVTESTDRGTTDTGKVFQALANIRLEEIIPEQNDDPMLMLQNLARQEHWLLDSTDVEIDYKTILGQGECGSVLAGWLHGSRIALKVIASKACQHVTHKRMKLLANEIRILRRVRHPNIVLFHGIVATDCINVGKNGFGIVLEFVSGQHLAHFLQEEKGKLRPHSRQRREVVMGMLRALRYLHAQRPQAIVHGDLKPENILIEPNSGVDGLPRSKLADFGFSKVLQQSGKAKRGDRPGGSARWAAPEVLLIMYADGISATHIPHLMEIPLREFEARMGCTPSADAYAVAKLSYYVVTEQTPMQHETLPDLLRSLQCTGLPPPLVWPSGSMSLKHVLDQCMVMPPADRKTVHDLMNQLETLKEINFDFVSHREDPVILE
eukprot:gnl/MRDRNA2_/MRDRNA2_83729_c0_seq2.p1 gnl/MRDRNA2_/MRDRNA2_83729_c0~~gnl/MRDRNA2_/MRDRNA2_83729_c0_seq2.p1  ORF type:complete len:646 (-),score=98.14 gnl/MRDRNA2_/MRDRNA2_83729_c0_seq2:537-2474(-)